MSSGTSTESLQPWQFFVLAAIASATAAIVLIRPRGVTTVVLLTILMVAAALVGLAALRAIRPLVSSQEDRTVVGERTRGVLEREKSLTLRTIKELEFDRAMGKISADDFREMSGRLRARAARLMRQIDSRAGYREQVERDLAARLAAGFEAPARAVQRSERSSREQGQAASASFRTCDSCATANDADARFCKACGMKL
jgi:hypothetical protein